jgi:hypothetical protein
MFPSGIQMTCKHTKYKFRIVTNTFESINVNDLVSAQDEVLVT